LHRLGALLAAPGADERLAIRGAEAFTVRFEAAATRPAAGRWRPSGAIALLAGDLELTEHAARWLTTSGAERLVLLTHTDGAGGASPRALAARLTAEGVTVSVQSCDFGDPAALSTALSDTAHEHRLSGLIYAPARDDASAARRILPALAEAADGLDLDAFVLFLPLRGLLPGPQDGATAAVAALADATVRRRLAAGRPGLWIAADFGTSDRELGGASDSDFDPEREPGRESGPDPDGAAKLPYAPVVAALAHAADRSSAGIVFADPAHTPQDTPLFADGTGPQRGEQASAVDLDALRAELADATPEARAELLGALLRTQVAAVLALADPERIGPHDDLLDLGLTSFGALELRTRLLAGSGLDIDAAAFFEHPTIAALIGHLDKVLWPDSGVGAL
jgi:aryl carrier-like protein